MFDLLRYFKQKFWIFECNYTIAEGRLDIALFGDGYHASGRGSKRKGAVIFSFVLPECDTVVASPSKQRSRFLEEIVFSLKSYKGYS